MLSAMSSAAFAQPTAFRISDLDWRDPHLFATITGPGCVDITNFDNFGVKGLNPQLQAGIQNDTDSDGHLDLNYLIVFDPLNQVGAGGTLQFGTDVFCSPPLAGTTCSPNSALPSFSYDNTPVECLSLLAGTTNAAYVPTIVSPTAPCFVAPLGTITIFMLFPLTLQDAYIAATYSGNPATGLVNGLIRGFVTETVANNTILPFSLDLEGLKPLSAYLRGGVNSCSQPSPQLGDKDVGPGGVAGWYVYLNFVASVVPLVSATPVQHNLPSLLALDAPSPNPFNPATTIRYQLPRAGSVQLHVYDAAGRPIASLVDGWRPVGSHQEMWNGRDALGLPVSSGVYFVRLVAGGEARTRKIVLLK